MKYKINYTYEDNGYENRAVLNINHPAHSSSYYDGGEPEDNYFTRDWNWVQEELNTAYQLGYQDGIKDQRENPTIQNL